MKEKIKLIIVFIVGIIISVIISTFIYIKIRPDKKVSYTDKKELKSTSDPDYISGVYSSSRTITSRITYLESKITYKDFDYTISTSNAVQKYYYATINISQTGKTPIAWSVIWHSWSKPTIVRGGDSTSSPTQLKIFIHMNEWADPAPNGVVRVVYMSN